METIAPVPITADEARRLRILVMEDSNNEKLLWSEKYDLSHIYQIMDAIFGHRNSFICLLTEEWLLDVKKRGFEVILHEDQRWAEYVIQLPGQESKVYKISF